MGKYLILFLSLFSLAKISNGQTNCRSECIASGKSHICQWETVCDSVISEPTPQPPPILIEESTPALTPNQNLINFTSPYSILNPSNFLNSPSFVVQTPQINMDVQENSAQTNVETKSENKTFISGFGLGLSLKLIGKPSIVQPNLFPVINMNQPMPIDYQNAGQLFIDIYGISLPSQISKFNHLKQDAVELEQ